MTYLFPQIAFSFSYTVKIPEAVIQEKITARQPLIIEKRFMTVILVAPKIGLLQKTNEVSISSPIDVIGFKQWKYSGSASIRGQLRYDPKMGEFFLDKTVVEQIKVIGLPEKYIGTAKNITQMAADEMLTKYPVDKLDDSLAHKLAKSLLLSVTVKENNMLAELGY
jgi:hypothetical protein